MNFTFVKTNLSILMKTSFLFPYRFRLVGWLLFVPSACLGLANLYLEFKLPFLNNFTDEVASLGVLIGLLFVAFARERIEDEMISQLRLEALQWSVYANYALLALAILLTYDFTFFHVLVYNMFTVLLVFIGRFRWSLYKMPQAEAPILA
jgi:hypothetical protein